MYYTHKNQYIQLFLKLKLQYLSNHYFRAITHLMHLKKI